MSNNLIQARISGVGFTREDIDQKAAALGLSRSEFLIKGVDLLMGIDIEFLNKMDAAAKRHNVPLPVVLQNYITGAEAERKFYGRQVSGTQIEFAKSNGHFLGYTELKNLLEAEYGRQYRAEQEAKLWRNIAVKQAIGEEFTAEESRLLADAKARREAYNEFKEAERKGLVAIIEDDED